MTDRKELEALLVAKLGSTWSRKLAQELVNVVERAGWGPVEVDIAQPSRDQRLLRIIDAAGPLSLTAILRSAGCRRGGDERTQWLQVVEDLANAGQVEFIPHRAGWSAIGITEAGRGVLDTFP